MVVCVHGTLPREDIYLALKPLSRNLGELELRALIAGTQQDTVLNSEGRFSCSGSAMQLPVATSTPRSMIRFRLCKNF